MNNSVVVSGDHRKRENNTTLYSVYATEKEPKNAEILDSFEGNETDVATLIMIG